MCIYIYIYIYIYMYVYIYIYIHTHTLPFWMGTQNHIDGDGLVEFYAIKTLSTPVIEPYRNIVRPVAKPKIL